LSFLHPDAPEVYNNNPNLRELAEDDEIRNTKKRIFSSISLGKPFYPMLCKRQDLDPSSKTSQLFRDKTGLLQKFRVEDKLDGERVIAHKQGSNVLMFSRNCNSLIDYANVFQKEFNECILADDVILDGEMMAWDSDMGCFLPFGQNRTVVLEQQEMGHSAHKWMCYKVFDILWANNVKVETNDEQVPSGDMTGQPLEHRKQWLHRLIVDSPLKLERMEGNVVATEMQSEQEEAVVKYFEDSINRQAEGIVVKQCNSTYTPGDRKGSWVKVKPEYMEGAADTLDVVIVGGYYAEGARRSGISHFLVAVADPSGGFEADEDYEAPSSSATNPQDGRTQLPKRWRVLCKVGSGYNKEELLEIQERLRDFWKK
jgi:DNA ligase-4